MYTFKNALSLGTAAGAITFVFTGNPLFAVGAAASTTVVVKALPAVGNFFNRFEKVKKVAWRANPQNENSNVLPMGVAGASIGYQFGKNAGFEGTELSYVSAAGGVVGVVGGTLIQSDEVERCGTNTREGCGDCLIGFGRWVKNKKDKKPLPIPRKASSTVQAVDSQNGGALAASDQPGDQPRAQQADEDTDDDAANTKQRNRRFICC